MSRQIPTRYKNVPLIRGPINPLFLVLFSIIAVGCGAGTIESSPDNGTQPAPDAGSGQDAQWKDDANGPDSGGASEDGDIGKPDLGSIDADPIQTDAALLDAEPSGADSGPQDVDGGSEDVDGGTNEDDIGVADSESSADDSGTDAGRRDSGRSDVGSSDSGRSDSGRADAGITDAARSDADSSDARPGDAQPADSALPLLGGCTMFTADDEWNRDVSGLPVDPVWTQNFNSRWGSATITVVFGVRFRDLAGVGWDEVPADQPLIPVSYDQFPQHSDPGPFPFPGRDEVDIQQGDPYCSMNTDCHILTVQRGTCMLYEGWACHWQNNHWVCGSGAKFDLKRNSYGQRPEGWTSAEAAGMPMLPGLIRYEEVAAGEIKHALRFSTACTGDGWIKPASHGARNQGCPANSPPLGLRIRLKANFDISGFNRDSQVILRALKKYGALLGDNNPNNAGFNFQGDHHTGWAPGQLYNLWNSIPNSAFEVVQTYQ